MTTWTLESLQPIAVDSTVVTPLADNKIEAYDDGFHVEMQQEALSYIVQSQLTTISYKHKHACCSHTFLLLHWQLCNYKSDHFVWKRFNVVKNEMRWIKRCH